MESLYQLWKALCFRYCQDEELIDRLWQEIESSYSQPRRHYHNLHHLAYMLKWVVKFRPQIQHPDSLLFAIFYHDVIYDTHLSDNEERSAALARDRMEQLGVSEETIQRSVFQILATKKHQATGDPDTDLLLDIDRAILGEEPDRYAAYAEGVRTEYAQYPDALYKPGRKQVLQQFLDGFHIYHTPYFRQYFESQARKNMRDEMEEN